MRRALLLAIPAFIAATLTAAPVGAAEPGYVAVAVRARPIEAFRVGAGPRFGALEFRGGLVLDSDSADFGALSGLDVGPDGRLYAVADTGFWFEAEIEEKDGRLVGLAGARMAPILDKTGKPVIGKRLGDAEGLRLTSKDGKLAALIAFEQVNNIRRFVAAPDFAGASSEILKLPPTMTGVPRNQGFEAVAVAPADSPLADAIVVVAERSLDKAGRHRGWIIGGPLAGSFAIERIGDFDVTDAAFLPDGDLLILERLFNFIDGVGMRIRRIAAGEIRPGAVVSGEILIEAGMGDQIDNMEGLAVGRGEGGETLILVVSDDNHSLLQRTLLLQFALLR